MSDRRPTVSLRVVFLAFLLYTAMTILFTWPLAAQLRVVDAGDSAFFAWEIGWELHALKTDPTLLPHANIFHPLPYVLGMDEPILGTTLLVLPLAVFTADPVLLFNLARLFTFVFSGLTAFWLAREVGVGAKAALFVGAAFAFSPIRTDQIAHLSTLGTQWLPVVLVFVVRFARTGATGDALAAGAFFALETYACGYHGLIGLAVLPPFVAVLLWRRLQWRKAGMAAAGVTLAGLLIVPLYALHRAALSPERYARGEEETAFFAASLESFLAASSWNRIYGGITEPFRNVGPNNLFPGLVLPLLALGGGLWLARRRQHPSREAIALALLLGVAVLVCLGPEIRLVGRSMGPGPFALLRELPVFQMIRVPSRAGIFVALPLALLAGKALDVWRPRPAAFVLVAAAALLETLIVPIPSPKWAQVVDTREPPPAVYEWLRRQPGREPVVELPMLRIDGAFSRPAYHESIYMVHSARGHFRPLLNGYAGIEPRRYQRLRDALWSFPSVTALSEIRQAGARYVVLHRGGYGPNQWKRLDDRLPSFLGTALVEVARFGGDVVYELRPPPPAER